MKASARVNVPNIFSPTIYPCIFPRIKFLIRYTNIYVGGRNKFRAVVAAVSFAFVFAFAQLRRRKIYSRKMEEKKTQQRE